MKQYLSFFRIRFLAGLQYRAAALAGIATQFAWGGMTILMYRAFYNSNSGEFPMALSALSSYIWMQQALLAMFMAWFFDSEIFDSITSGSIAYELCRPCDLYTLWFVKNMAIRLSRTVLRCLPILLVAILLPAPYGLSLPPDLFSAFLFLLSLFLGFMVMIAFSMLIYISAFYTLSSAGVRILMTSVIDFFTGGVIPIPFFPEAMQPVLYALPFASMQTIPFLIYVGYMGQGEALKSIGWQCLWLLVLILAGRLWMKRALKKVVVQGG